jgi:type IV pilus assembly protein PilB
MPLGKEQLQEIYVKQSGILKPEEFDAVVKAAAENRQPLEQTLMERGFVTPHYFLTLLSEYFKVPSTELKITEINLKAIALISETFATSHMVFPFEVEDNILKVAMADPTNTELLLNLRQATSMEIRPYVAIEHAIKRALVLYKGDLKTALSKLVEQIKNDKDSTNSTDSSSPSIVTLLNALIENAILVEASDIHIEPFEDEIIVRFRVDGLLKTVLILPAPLHASLIARLKVLASLKSDEKRLPQDGRFSIKMQDQQIDLRLSTIPSLWGEKAVMRVLRKDSELFDLGNIGLLDSDLPVIKKYLRLPFGMILVCGPTGSGKTSTLYAFLQAIGLERIDVVNISTIEDPIEYTIPRVTQIQTHPEINLTFATGLRSLLRQDPDIIMVGEIRDKETADIAVRAALVGRLLLSSLHTNDAVGAIPRLIDMDAEPYIVSSTISLVVAQRLVRKLCTHCRESYKLDAEDIKNLNATHHLEESIKSLKNIGTISPKNTVEEMRFYKSKGCEKCDNTGYIGRTAVFEILEITDQIRNIISAGGNGVQLKEAALANGMKTMFADGLAKVILGITDLEELLRVAV